eukprot:CAMPEP_0204080130 /NCGR_PEP_ID=MMETSP0360-20130528/173506_1 /ASSEMBLY_ACC=CAM_ASM_000342 /TAXON_ID=268821 /ORGANISM="Scrippsiella Hangoei, Strain SHTV-5" /LENGTH=39 /DNA_ID= /DNA_START= /DNA_END= /DNA_ORIENTATION=
MSPDNVQLAQQSNDGHMTSTHCSQKWCPAIRARLTRIPT